MTICKDCKKERDMWCFWEKDVCWECYLEKQEFTEEELLG